MRRRRFLQLAAVAPLAACSRLTRWGLPIHVYQPGLTEGHGLRDLKTLPPVSETRRVGIAIVGSGVAGLSCAWKLAKEGRRDFVVLQGPEPEGNAAGGRFGDNPYPRGAHYLPLPSMQSVHVREMLADAGVIERDPFAERPWFDERALVHAPSERLLIDGQWQDGLLPRHGIAASELHEQARFFEWVERLKATRGSDGKPVFAIPMALSSEDLAWRSLDGLSFRDWLLRHGYRAPSLHWYLDYCCRDDYGADYRRVSAWAGLHYFACRTGRAANGEDGTVLTWPNGLQALTGFMRRRVAAANAQAAIPGFALSIREGDKTVEVVYADGAAGKIIRLLADRVVCAMPLHVAKRIVHAFEDYGFKREHLPDQAPWLISNLWLDGFPRELDGAPLSWDNVVYRGPTLGYVVSTHQDIRLARPSHTVFTAYHALTSQAPPAERRRIVQAAPESLFDEAIADVQTAYGWTWRKHCRAVEVTVRAHAMAIPAPGFLSRLRSEDAARASGRLLFAHADLSGFSLFEEAAWWGYRAAESLSA